MKHNIGRDLAWGAGIIVVALAASYARRQGVIDQDGVQRIVFGAIGLMVAAFGNRMPKAFAPSPVARKVQRVGGWSLAISGLIYAALWVFAPFEVALVGGCAAIIAGMAVTFAYCARMRREVAVTE